ncbi:MAG: sulfotransferase domain-containing protein [Terriglobales bacterium]
MIRHLIAGAKRVFGLHRPRRSLRILPDDVFLVSFPKSGNTWTRFLLANLVYPDQRASFGNLHKLIPDPEDTTKRHFDRMPRPRIIKSHECFDPRYPRVIYIVRDPRDVVISQYHYHRKVRQIEDDYPLERFVARFIAGETGLHGSWGENVASWMMARNGRPDFLLLRYEDLLSDTCRELAKVARFLGMDASSERISQAVERSSADQMRKSEKAESNRATLTRHSRPDISFVRAAKSGGWKHELPESLLIEIETAWHPLMQRFGYQLATRSSAELSEPWIPLGSMQR